MIKTLRRNFIAVAMCSITLVLVTIIAAINVANYHDVCKNADQRILMISENGGVFPKEPAIASPPERPAAPSMEKPGHTLSAEAFFDTRYFTVTLSGDGSVLTVNTGKIAAITTSEASDYALLLWRRHKEKGFLEDYRYQAVAVSTDSGEAASMYIFLYAGRELDTFRTFLLSSVAVSLLGLLLVLLLVVYFSKRALAPVVESYEKQKRFITDASHELKTPLTIIDANTEVLEMTSGESQWTKSTRNQVARLTALTEKLVLLSRMDEEAKGPEHLRFPLSDAVLDVAEPFCTLAASKEKTLSLDVQPDVTIKGDEAALRQLVSLLLDNAVKYTPANGWIVLTLCHGSKNRGAVLTVTNSAEPMQPGRHEELFERFYRPDASRNSKAGGFGLGLSVAHAIVNSHKGKITAKSEDGVSLAITVTLP
ncbi:MAG: HAMP domain-containing histidine kinase [Muribaculaceae bacterium]|nr:HAMP domain-containing histidine kinase [Roseburia sp.]MCM1432074.1 HAMP domain-containing histidine kinase [Muribaculaceae bacterium]MCM1492126.1 HAMP domain-containing histidine kinase [Muribaculaceae bacterium]